MESPSGEAPPGATQHALWNGCGRYQSHDRSGEDHLSDLQTTDAEGNVMNRYPRPQHGYCYLDFLDFWLFDALFRNDAEMASKYAREVAHWALLMYPELAPIPNNVVLGEN